jgi:hypothetical protein
MTIISSCLTRLSGKVISSSGKALALARFYVYNILWLTKLNLHRTNGETGWATVVLVLWTLILLGVLVAPIGEMNFNNPWGFRHWDKIAHVGLFAVTAFIGVFGSKFLDQLRSRILFAIVLSLFLAIGTEFAQSFINLRNMSFYDLLADMIGLCAGLLFYALLYRSKGLRYCLKL